MSIGKEELEEIVCALEEYTPAEIRRLIDGRLIERMRPLLWGHSAIREVPSGLSIGTFRYMNPQMLSSIFWTMGVVMSERASKLYSEISELEKFSLVDHRDDLVFLSAEDLSQEAHLARQMIFSEDVIAAGLLCGYELVPIALAFSLRLMYCHQPVGELMIPATKPIESGYTKAGFLLLSNENGKLHLDVGGGNPRAHIKRPLYAFLRRSEYRRD